MRRQLIRLDLEDECDASQPYEQFVAQCSQESERMDADRRNNMYRRPASFASITEHARFIVKTRWIEQGIWREDWNTHARFLGTWKHEEPPPAVGLFGTVANGKRPPSSHKVDLEEDRQREASRPYFQFIAQLSHERLRIQQVLGHPSRPWREHPMHRAFIGAAQGRLLEEEARQWALETPNDGHAMSTTPPDINTTAYERLKSAWTDWRIWNDKWGVLPGMSWKHEEPFEEMLRERLVRTGLAVDVPDAEEPERAEEAPRQIAVETGIPFSGPIFGLNPYPGRIFPLPAVEADGNGGPAPPQRPFADIFTQRPYKDIFRLPREPSPKAGSHGSAHSEPERQPEESSRAPSPPVRQSSRRDRAAQPKQPAKVEAVPLRAVRSGRVAKPRKPKQPARPKESAEPDAPATNLAPTPLRRSPRFQVASQGMQAPKLNGVPDQPSPVRRSTKQKTGGSTKTGKPRSVGVTKRGRRQSD